MEPMGFESTNRMETKEFCGAAWPSKVLKGIGGNSYCPLIAPKKFFIPPPTRIEEGHKIAQLTLQDCPAK